MTAAGPEAAAELPAAQLAGPRIYALRPAAVADPADGPALLQRIAAMGFDTLLVPRPEGNPAEGGPADASLVAWCRLAGAAGLAVLAEFWPPRDLLESAALEPPDLGRHGDPRPESDRQALRAVLSEPDAAAALHRRLLSAIDTLSRAGIAGLLCRRAHWLPPASWARAIAAARAARPLRFVAEALGVAPEALQDMAGTGFDWFLDSARWWDFRQPWLLEQQRAFRSLGPTISFPEFLGGAGAGEEPLAAAAGDLSPDLLLQLHRARYLFATCFADGVMMPMGYEAPLAQAAAGPALEDFIAGANALKARLPVLQGAGCMHRLSGPDGPLAMLLRTPGPHPAQAAQAALLLVNPTPHRIAVAGWDRVAFATDGRLGAFQDVTPPHPAAGAAPPPDAAEAGLEPFGVRLLVGQVAERRPGPAPSRREAERRMHKLAEARIAIEAVSPEVDGGRFPAKRVAGELVTVEADIFCDGHEQIAAALCVRGPDPDAAGPDAKGEGAWRRIPMRHLVNDRWQARFRLEGIGRHLFTIEAWRDLHATWRLDTLKKRDAGQDLELEAQEGLALLERAEAVAPEDRAALAALQAGAAALRDDAPALVELLAAPETAALMARIGPRANLTVLECAREIRADRPLGAWGAWYEMMPRSQSGDPRRHGTFDDVIVRLPYVRDLGFDVLYFPPIHPIGRTNRKGRNNSLTAGPDDPGSPYAIGAAEGGHDAIHPELGTFDDFRRLVTAAREHGLEIALDFAIQCSPDHPWIRAHPEWFDWRPDGSIRFAENPPKKYEDIVNLHFYREAFPALWYALRDIVLFWVGQGVRIFRVDNPHTKPLPFWEWLIREVQEREPGAVFLAEAFTRPKMMRRLAKVGFTQSYSYFTWRNTKAELTEYLTELSQGPSVEYMRPNFFANTPDINPWYLQSGGRAGFQVRLAAAALLSPLYGIYNGFELCEAAALPGREEYLDSEKYEIRAWDWDRPGHIRADIALINHIRRENPAFHRLGGLHFLNAWNDQVLAFYRITAEGDNCVLAAINLDPHAVQEADFEIPLWAFGLPDHGRIEVVDLVEGHRFAWSGKVQHVVLDPRQRPYAIWRLVPPQGGRP